MMKIEPVRIQRSRKAKQVSPNGLPIVYVGRPGKYGNPYRIRKDFTAAQAVAAYQVYVLPQLISESTTAREVDEFGESTTSSLKNELAGKNLSCWCPVGSPCHADLLLKIANQPG